MNDHTTHLQSYIDLWHAGDEQARQLLIDHAFGRLRRLAARLLGAYPSVRRWEQTDDVLQNASVRLWKSLAEVEPRNVKSFFGLAAVQIRRELLDLARKHKQRRGADTAGQEIGQENEDPLGPKAPDASLTEWTELHENVQELPKEQLEVFDLLYYHGLTQAETADVLGHSVRTIKRRWREARKSLYDIYHGNPFGDE